MSKAEKEAVAVAKHRCPVCSRAPGMKCVRGNSASFFPRELQRPHKERVAKVTE